jgi:hypothetical protein
MKSTRILRTVDLNIKPPINEWFQYIFNQHEKANQHNSGKFLKKKAA